MESALTHCEVSVFDSLSNRSHNHEQQYPWPQGCLSDRPTCLLFHNPSPFDISVKADTLTSSSSEMSATRCYETCPVDRKTRSIRLFRISHRSDPSLIWCEMTCFSLSRCRPYVAVSYTWGATRATRSINVNGVVLAVQQNLWEFLEQKRKVNSPEYYWIDAICIDQANVYERNHQVGLMRDIYSKVRFGTSYYYA